jgi:hypothetical protein
MARSCWLVIGAAIVVTALVGSANAQPTRHAHARVARTGGTQVWVRRFAGPNRDTSAATVFSPDGSKVFVTGTTHSTSSNDDMLTTAYNASTGSPIWSRQYNGPANGVDFGVALAISSDGSRLFVTGGSQGSGTSYDFVTIAYDPTSGQPLWRARFDATAHSDDEPAALAVSPDGTSVYVTGTSTGATTSSDYATVAYDAATGSTRWIRRYDFAHAGEDAFAIAVSPDGTRVFVTGDSANGSPPVAPASTGARYDYDYATLAYDAATGATDWTARFDGPIQSDDSAYAIGVSPDGTKVFVGGDVTNEAAQTETNSDFGTVAYNASTGAKLWSAIYSGANQDQDDQLYALAVSPDRTKVVVTGPSTHNLDTSTGLNYDYATLAYDTSTGTRVWVRTFDGPDGLDDQPAAIAIAPDSSQVIVTGYSTATSTKADFLTIAYTLPHGFTIWQHRQNSTASGDDLATALAIAHDSSRVAVTGMSAGSGTDFDWMTAAYTTS